MPSTTEFIDDVIGKLLAHNFRGLTNHDVYDKKLAPKDPPNPKDWPYEPFSYEPRQVYFCNMRLTPKNSWHIDNYHYSHMDLDNPLLPAPIHADMIESITATLAQNARLPLSQQDPKPLSNHTVKKMDWRHVSYVVVFMDSDTWKFAKRSNGLGGIVFNPAKGGKANSSFFDAHHFDVDMSVNQDGGEMRTAISFINHMTTETSIDVFEIERGISEYSFDIYFDVGYDNPEDEPVPMTMDPTGTNTGPPQRP